MMQLFQFAASEGKPVISLPAEKIFSWNGVMITNSVILGTLGFILVLAMLGYTAWVIRSGRKRNFLVNLIDWVYEGLYGTVLNVVGDEKIARRLAPLPITIFFFILVQYYLGLLPVVGPITYHGYPIFRAYVSDLNTTLGLALVTLVASEIYAFKAQGFFSGIGRYFKNPVKDPAGAFEGILEIVAQFSRSMRLFGNVFAGEVLLVMIAFLAQYVAAVALPVFYLFEIFIGGIQAYIFFMLTTIFVSLGLSAHGSHDESPDHVHSSADTVPAAPDRG
jgi:F-type H+-transporting ATPase subunit a